MSQLKPYQKIASRFHISQESAKYFLGRVQKSFKKQKPPHALILEFIETQAIESMLEPYDIASMMSEGGIWRHDLISPPVILANGDDELN